MQITHFSHPSTDIRWSLGDDPGVNSLHRHRREIYTALIYFSSDHHADYCNDDEDEKGVTPDDEDDQVSVDDDQDDSDHVNIKSAD